MQGLMLQLLLDAAANGVFTDLVGALMGTEQAKKQKNRTKLALYNILAIALGVVLLSIALGFLVAAGYMQLTTLFTPPLAALLAAAALGLVGGALVWFAKPGGEKKPEPPPAEPVEGADAFVQGILNVVQSIINYAQKNPYFVPLVVMLIGIWLSMSDDGKDEDTSDHP
jgi:peptidoglycan/LPS O-acetylase OafA/YrhL